MYKTTTCIDTVKGKHSQVADAVKKDCLRNHTAWCGCGKMTPLAFVLEGTSDGYLVELLVRLLRGRYVIRMACGGEGVNGWMTEGLGALCPPDGAGRAFPATSASY